MKKFLKSKKALTAAALSLVLAIGGMTYAWFITPPVNGGGDVTVGTMLLKGEDDLVFKTASGQLLTYLVPEDDGTSYFADIKLASVGNISQIVKVEVGKGAGDGIIMPPYVRDANGMPEYEVDATGKLVLKIDPNGTDTIKPFAGSALAVGLDTSNPNFGNLADVFWLVDPATKDLYAVFFNDTTDGSLVEVIATDTACKLKIVDANAFDYEYMGAKVQCTLSAKGSQIHPTAIQQAFGIDMNDLEYAIPGSTITPFFSGPSNYQLNVAKWEAILAEFAE